MKNDKMTSLSRNNNKFTKLLILAKLKRKLLLICLVIIAQRDIAGSGRLDQILHTTIASKKSK